MILKPYLIVNSVSVSNMVLLALSLCLGCQWMHAQERVVWDERFEGASLNSNLTQYTNGSDAASIPVGGILQMDTGSPTTSAQASVYTRTNQSGSLTTYNGAALYNFYQHPVQARFDIVSIFGTPVGRSRTIFYFSIGEGTSGQRGGKISYLPITGSPLQGLGFRLEQLKGGLWRLAYSSLANGKHTGGVAAKLNGKPDAITYTLHGTQATIQLEGTTIQERGRVGSGEPGGTELTVELDDLSAILTSYTMAFGAYNFGDATDQNQTVVNLDSVLVTLGSDKVVGIPEVSNYALLSAFIALVWVMVRRR